MSEEIYYAPATELAAKIRQKVLSPVEVVQAHLERIEQLNPTLNAIVFFTGDPLEQAREAEEAVMRGDGPGPLPRCALHTQGLHRNCRVANVHGIEGLRRLCIPSGRGGCIPG